MRSYAMQTFPLVSNLVADQFSFCFEQASNLVQHLSHPLLMATLKLNFQM